jgi:MFS family permease
MIDALYSRHKETIHNFSWRSLQLFGKYGVTAVIFFVAAKLLSLCWFQKNFRFEFDKSVLAEVLKYAVFCVVTGLALSVSLYFGIPVVVKTIFPRYNAADFFLITNILLPLMPFYVWGAVLNQDFIVPAGMAKIYVAILLIGGILNVILNYVFISLFGFVGVFWVMVGLHSGSTIVATVYFYIKMNALAENRFCPPKANLGDSGEQRA